MTEYTVYVCDTCGKQFTDDEEACLECEFSHILDQGKNHLKAYDRNGNFVEITTSTWINIAYFWWNDLSGINGLRAFESKLLGYNYADSFEEWADNTAGFIRYDSRRDLWEDAEKLLKEARKIQRIYEQAESGS